MSQPRPWPILSREHLQHCKVFDVSRLRTRSPRDGSEHDFYTIDAADWVNVVPLTPGGQLVMVRQYRHGSGDVTLEIPGGIVDPGETPRDAAGRELLEETGYAPAEVAPLGSVNPNPALFGNRLHTFVARGCAPMGDVNNSGTEETVVELVERADVGRLVDEGIIDHALVVAGLYAWERAGR